MTRLAAVLTERGLRMRPQRNRAPAPISAKYLTLVLRDRYYLGTVTYKGEEFAGRHEALVTPELFARVQAVLDGRLAKTGERQRKHRHYLKSTLWCGRCHERGIESRCFLTRAQGHGGEYWYFVCTARQDRACGSPLRADRGCGSGSAAALRDAAVAWGLRRPCVRGTESQARRRAAEHAADA